MSVCYYCGPTDRELRPYGPGGTDVCFPCATETPEREAEARLAFDVLLDSALLLSPVNGVVIGTPSGPQPLHISDLENP